MFVINLGSTRGWYLSVWGYENVYIPSLKMCPFWKNSLLVLFRCTFLDFSSRGQGNECTGGIASIILMIYTENYSSL